MPFSFLLRIFFFGLFLNPVAVLIAQGDYDTGYLEIRGSVRKSGKPIEGAVITVIKDGANEDSYTIKKNGKFTFELQWDHEYIIKFNAPGYIPTKMVVSTKLPPSVKLPIWPVYEIDVPFYGTSDSAVNKAALNQPITKVAYDPKKKVFKDDDDYLEQFSQILYIPEEKKVVAPPKEKEKDLALEKTLKPDAALKPEEQAKKLEEEKIRKEQAIAKTGSPKKSKTEPGIEQPLAGNADKETDAIKRERIKEAREIETIKNKAVKSQHENSILKVVAENERKGNEAEWLRLKNEEEFAEAIEKMKQYSIVKPNTFESETKKKTHALKSAGNLAIKAKELNNTLIRIAEAEREADKAKSKGKPKTSSVLPVVSQVENKDVHKVETITTITDPLGRTTFKKITYAWGTTYYFKNNKTISAELYKKELSLYSIKK